MKQLKIGKHNLLFAERSAKEVLDLDEYSRKNFDDAEDKLRFNTNIYAIAIAQSIRRARKQQPFWKPVSKLKLFKYTSSYIFKNMSFGAFLEMREVIDELQGDKKKVKETENRLEENLRVV